MAKETKADIDKAFYDIADSVKKWKEGLSKFSISYSIDFFNGDTQVGIFIVEAVHKKAVEKIAFSELMSIIEENEPEFIKSVKITIKEVQP